MTSNDGTDNLPPALAGDNAPVCVKQLPLDGVNKVTLAQGFPIQSIGGIKNYLAGIWSP